MKLGATQIDPNLALCQRIGCLTAARELTSPSMDSLASDNDEFSLYCVACLTLAKKIQQHQPGQSSLQA